MSGRLRPRWPSSEATPATVSAARARRAVREALDAWDDLDLPLDHATAVLAVACVGGPGSVPKDHAQRGRAYVDARGAVSLQARFADVGL